MALPSSGGLTAAQILGELDEAFPQTWPNNSVLTLAQKAAGSSLVIPTDLYGKSKSAFIEIPGGVSTVGGVATFTGCNFGPIGPARRVVIGVGWNASGGVATALISSATIAGVGAAVRCHTAIADGLGGNVGCGMIDAVVAGGTSGTVVVNLTEASNRGCSIGIFREVNLTSIADTLFSSAALGAGGHAHGGTIITALGGTLLAVGCTNISPFGTHSWAGATEKGEDNNGTTGCRSFALAEHTTASGARALNVTNTGAGGYSIAAVSWN